MKDPTIRRHLRELAEAGVVTGIEFPVDERIKGQPNKLYGIIDEARQFFDWNDVFVEDHCRELYARFEKPDDIQAAEEARRPTH
jgi:DNA-binding Lrp family transcriptional regulator